MKTFSNNILRAIKFTIQAHDGQYRKFTGNTIPYAVHPLTVANMVSRAGEREEVIIASLLHDIIEDTSVIKDDIMIEFGDAVAELVMELTNYKDPNLNRAQRKEIEVERAHNMSREAKVIRLADIIDNVPSILKHEAGDFANLYVTEKKRLYHALAGSEQDRMYDAVWQILYFPEAIWTWQ